MKTFFPFRKCGPLLTLIMVLCFTTLSAQNTRPASFDMQTKVVQIDESLPFGYQYDIDVSDFNLGDQPDVEKYFAKLETDMVKYKVTSKKEVKLQLNLRAHPTWTAQDWNNYLKSINHE